MDLFFFFFKFLLNLLQYCFCVRFWLLGPKVCGILGPRAGIERTLEGEVLTTGPPDKPLVSCLLSASFVPGSNLHAVGAVMNKIIVPVPRSLASDSEERCLGTDHSPPSLCDTPLWSLSPHSSCCPRFPHLKGPGWARG